MHAASLGAPEGARVWPLFSVVAHAGAFAVTVAHRDGAAVVVPIQRRHEPAHRSDVALDDIGDLYAMALPGGFYLIRTGRPYRLAQGVVVGHCPPAIRRQIVDALRREAEAVRLETKYRRPGCWDDNNCRLAPGARRRGAISVA